MDSSFSGLRKIEQQLVVMPEADCINIIGDPGCDSLGAGIMSLLPGHLLLILRNFVDFTNTTAGYPVFTLKGNHDTEYYEDFFGKPNYAIESGDLPDSGS